MCKCDSMGLQQLIFKEIAQCPQDLHSLWQLGARPPDPPPIIRLIYSTLLYSTCRHFHILTICLNPPLWTTS